MTEFVMAVGCRGIDLAGRATSPAVSEPYRGLSAAGAGLRRILRRRLHGTRSLAADHGAPQIAAQAPRPAPT